MAVFPFNLIRTPKELKNLGVLGMNSRNINFIARYNPRHLYPMVDDKLNTKRAAQKKGVAVPELLGVIETQRQLRNLSGIISPLQKFVIKPTRGSGGKGILVITGRDFGYYLKSNGSKLELLDLHRHINNVLSGLYSLGGKPDCAMIEAMIEYDDVFSDYTYEGVPDIRIIVFKGFPVMAMLRCATHASDGRANLHQGAIGVGIDLCSGRSLYAVQHNRPIDTHPDTGKSFSQLQIPHWQQILELAASCYEMAGLGYIGCDIVLDHQLGPMILELNARPGLAIQLASGQGLLTRLEQINRLSQDAMGLSASDRVAYLLHNVE
ncbi:MAG: alpha-L-glutamate ligase-like protein [Spongiibacteraceae bacterium]|nr:alpha-L-glutamate ligase-like protein [Spongiibacteraceae bacterium]